MSSWREAFARLGPTVRTAVHLRPRQLAAFVRRRAAGPARSPVQSRALGLDRLRLPNRFVGPSAEGTPGAEGVILLHQPPHDPLRFGWADNGDPLWTYTLHYHGWLTHGGCPRDRARATVLDWIDEHVEGVGWEPYPTAMRLQHWLAWLARDAETLQGSELELVLASLAAQAQHLARHVEYHLDGNHLWTNLVALVAVGLAFDGHVAYGLRERFAPELVRVIGEQLSDDGVHRERTPSYHCLLAEQLDVVRQLAEPYLPGLADVAGGAMRRMVRAAAAFTHPDGDVALWGDSQLGLPHAPARLAARLGESLSCDDVDASGFSRRHSGDWTLLWNLGGVGLAHQVGHIHGDCLAIEISLSGRNGDSTRILVDGGTGTYMPGDERSYARSTAAHNTATIGKGDPDQHELWLSHRIGRRATPIAIEQGPRRLVGCIRGHTGTAMHRREITLDGRSISITDIRSDLDEPMTVRYHFPASIQLRPTPRGFVAFVPRGPSFEIDIGDATHELGPAPGWRAMGMPAARTCLCVRPRGESVTVRLRSGG